MKVEFSVVAFTSSDACVSVTGNVAALGNWHPDKSVELHAVSERSPCGPTCFTGEVEIPNLQFVRATPLAQDGGEDIRFTFTTNGGESSVKYKFLLWESTTPLESTESDDAACFPNPPQVTHLTSDGFLYTEKDLLQPIRPLQYAEKNKPPFNARAYRLIWEGSGPDSNRALLINSPPDAITTDPLRHVLHPQRLYITSERTYYSLPPVDLIGSDTDSGLRELSHTARYYQGIKQAKLMHFNHVIPRLYCGTCPRKLQHLDILRDRYAVGAILNLQTLEDLQTNWVDANDPIEQRDPLTLRQIYTKRNLLLIHLPTTDMCSAARAGIIAEAAWLLAGYIVANPDKYVYVHCNAGVGRAVACCCAFLHYCLGLSLERTLNFMRTKRPVAYIDTVALAAGKKEFDRKFAKAALCLPLVKKSFSSHSHSCP